MQGSEPKKRDERLDVAKGLLIGLVVIGHLLEGANFWSATTVRLPLTLIYAFHMPAFAFLTGITGTPKKLWRRIGPLLVLMFLFQGLYYGATRLFEPEADFEWNTPYWLLWFLLATIWWLLMTPIIDKFPKGSIIGAGLLAVCVSAAPWIGYPLSLGRAIVFLPFYAVGYVYGQRILTACTAAPRLHKGLTIAGAGTALMVLCFAHLQHGWFYGSMSSASLQAEPIQGMVIRAGLLVVAAVAITAFLMLVPQRESPGLATVGRHTLPVFLLHGFAVLAVGSYLPGILADNNIVAVVLVILLAAGIVVLTSGTRTNTVLRDVSGYLFKGPAQQVRRPDQQPPENEGNAAQRSLATVGR